MNKIVERPWGFYRIIEECENYKIKEIVVNPGKRISLQVHKFRDETWKIIKGKAKLELSLQGHPDLIEIDLDSSKVDKDFSINIRRNELHRIENIGETPLIFIEIQTGDSFSESDVTRLEDDYGRT